MECVWLVEKRRNRWKMQVFIFFYNVWVFFVAAMGFRNGMLAQWIVVGDRLKSCFQFSGDNAKYNTRIF